MRYRSFQQCLSTIAKRSYTNPPILQAVTTIINSPSPPHLPSRAIHEALVNLRRDAAGYIPTPSIMTEPPGVPKSNNSSKPIESYISLILDETTSNIQSALEKPSNQDSANIFTASLLKLSERAHEELQTEIMAWAASKKWNRLKWWKLIWRVDDIGITATDLLHNILQQTEKELIFISGRANQAGLMEHLPDDIWTTIPLPIKSEPVETTIELGSKTVTLSEPPLYPETTFSPSSPTVTPLEFLPYPQHIRIMKQIHTTISIPELERYAQNALFTCLCTTGLSIALSTLIYLSWWPTLGVYGVGSMAALGTMFAVQRYQSKWEGKREEFLNQVSQSAIAAVTDAVKTLFNVMQSSLDRVEGHELAKLNRADEAVKLVKQVINCN